MSQKEASLGLLLFTHASLLQTLFETAGFPIKFVMGTAGVTNSRKTSMVLVICKIFGRSRMKADAEFATSTACGIEKMLGKYKDGVVVIDDFKPAVNQTQQRLMKEKLDQLIRLYGDRVGKKRMTEFNVGNRNSYFPISGGCAITMEVVNGVESTLTRLCLIEIGKDDVRNDVLSFFQANKTVLSTHFYSFIAWVSENYSQVVDAITQMMPYYRQRAKFKVERYAEMFATFCVTAQILSMYAEAKGYRTKFENDNFLQEVVDTMCFAFTTMGKDLAKRDKHNFVIWSLEEALRKRVLVPMALTPENCCGRYDCYEDEEILYLRSQTLLQILGEYCKKYHELEGVTGTDELIGILERHDLIVINTKSDGKASRKLPQPKGNTLRYLYIRKNQLKKLEET